MGCTLRVALPATSKWVNQCHNEPRRSEIKMEALNELLHGYGVEALRIEDAHVDNFHFDIVASYLNTGDTYSPTILLDHEESKFRLTTWGDFMESRELQMEES